MKRNTRRQESGSKDTPAVLGAYALGLLVLLFWLCLSEKIKPLAELYACSIMKGAAARSDERLLGKQRYFCLQRWRGWLTKMVGESDFMGKVLKNGLLCGVLEIY